MALHLSLDLEADDRVLFEESSSVRKVILDRPKKLNCLTYEMVQARHPLTFSPPDEKFGVIMDFLASQVMTKLEAYEHDPAVGCIILKGNGRAFCSGGDVMRQICTTMAGHWSLGTRVYDFQLILDYLLATYTKPVVALIDGIVMGGGAGLSMQATFRVVTENTVFAMPEASIGLFPDVGASKFLSKLPGAFGEYVALTGARLNGVEMLACGLASHFVPSKELPLIEKAMCDEAPFSKSTILDLLDKFAHHPNLNVNSSFLRLDIINRCFSRATVEEILSSLEDEIENNGGAAEKWMKVAMKSMRSASPTSLKITLKSIRRGRTQSLEQCLNQEHTVFCHMVRGSVNRDFFEGSRAILLDKDGKAKWNPSKLELVTEEMVDKFFTSLDGVDPDWVNLRLPTRSGQTRSRARL